MLALNHLTTLVCQFFDILFFLYLIILLSNHSPILSFYYLIILSFYYLICRVQDEMSLVQTNIHKSNEKMDEFKMKMNW